MCTKHSYIFIPQKTYDSNYILLCATPHQTFCSFDMSGIKHHNFRKYSEMYILHAGWAGYTVQCFFFVVLFCFSIELVVWYPITHYNKSSWSHSRRCDHGSFQSHCDRLFIDLMEYINTICRQTFDISGTIVDNEIIDNVCSYQAVIWTDTAVLLTGRLGARLR